MSASRVDTATVVFTDLVGSTETRTRLGEDAAEALRLIHDALVAHSIESNRGVVVKHLGDGAMATFTAANDAVAAAVSLQQAIDQHNRQANERLSVRVGISVGDVTFEGDDCFGLPVVEAQRLEATAEPDTIVCAELVMHLARGRGGHEFTSIGALDLKGLPDSVRACRVEWVPLAPAAAVESDELPPVLTRAGGLPFAGRAESLESLREAWKRCAVGGFEVVLLAGEPGIGKTRLARQVAKIAQSQNGLVLAGRCDEDVMVPFQALGTALAWFADHADPRDVADSLGRFPGDLVRLVPHLGDIFANLPEPLSSEPEAERYRLMEAVTSWLETGGLDTPRMLVIDDLHWADKGTLLLLRHVISAAPAGLFIVCTYRDTDVDRAHPLSSMLADLRRMPNVERVALGGLEADGVKELLVRTGGHDLDDVGTQFAEVVHRETAGNPFFVGEVLRHLAETGALVERDGRWTSDLTPEQAGIPEGIREVVGRRLSRLGDDTEAVLRTAAVIGYEFDVGLLVDVVQKGDDEVVDALEDAVAANLAEEIGVDRYRFAHALVRETLHGELSSTRRARQHRRVAVAMEARHGGEVATIAADLAGHWVEASAGGDPTRAIALSIMAGDEAYAVGAPETAVTWYSTALELIEDDEVFAADRRTTLVKQAIAKIPAGHRDHVADANAAAAEALAADDLDCAVDALLVTSRVSFDEDQDEDEEKIDLLRQALELIGPEHLIWRGDLLGELASELIFTRDVSGRAAALDEMHQLMTRMSAADRGRITLGPGRTSWGRPSVESFTAAMENFRTLADETASATEKLYALEIIWYMALVLGQRAKADAVDAEARSVVDAAADKFFEHRLMIKDQLGRIVSGEMAEAAHVTWHLFNTWTDMGMPEATTYLGVGLFNVAVE